MVKRPTGVVINQLTYRGQLLFSSKPILLQKNVYRLVKLNLKFLELSYELMKMLKGKVKEKGNSFPLPLPLSSEDPDFLMEI